MVVFHEVYNQCNIYPDTVKFNPTKWIKCLIYHTRNRYGYVCHDTAQSAFKGGTVDIQKTKNPEPDRDSLQNGKNKYIFQLKIFVM